MKNNTINYIEMYTTDMDIVKTFYWTVFDWEFVDYWSSYAAFSNSGIEWGFELVDTVISGWPLIILIHDDLDFIQERIIQSWGKIVIDTFEFPGGKRFEFTDPVGNKLAVWNKL